jgi:hypothetical protein
LFVEARILQDTGIASAEKGKPFDAVERPAERLATPA